MLIAIIIGITITILFVLFGYMLNIVLKKVIENKQKRFEIIVLMITIVSIIFGISTYFYDQYNTNLLRNQNEKIIIENALEDINVSLHTSRVIINNSNRYSEGYYFTIRKYKFNFLEKMTEFYDNQSVRKEIFINIDRMEQANRMLEKYNIFLQLINNDKDKNKELREENIEMILSASEEIKEGLESLRIVIKKED